MKGLLLISVLLGYVFSSNLVGLNEKSDIRKLGAFTETQGIAFMDECAAQSSQVAYGMAALTTCKATTITGDKLLCCSISGKGTYGNQPFDGSRCIMFQEANAKAWIADTANTIKIDCKIGTNEKIKTSGFALKSLIGVIMSLLLLA